MWSPSEASHNIPIAFKQKMIQLCVTSNKSFIALFRNLSKADSFVSVPQPSQQSRLNSYTCNIGFLLTYQDKALYGIRDKKNEKLSLL